MELYQVIVLAVIQGITEFLPVSSHAHLILAPMLFGWKDPGLSFDIALHAGTLAAVLLFFFRDWLQVIAQGLGVAYGSDPELKRNRMLLWYLVVGSIPAAIIGFIFKEQAEDWKNPYVIGGMMIAIGCPTASDAVKPNILSAAGFHVWMMPSRSLLTIASSEERMRAVSWNDASSACFRSVMSWR